MTILVTGAAGHIGSNAVRMLLDAGKAVVAFDRRPPGPDSVIAGMDDRVAWVYGSIDDLPLLLNAIKKHKVDGIIHGAAIIAQHANARPLECVRTNIEGTINVLEAARIMDLKRVVCCTSSSVAGEHKDTSLAVALKETDLDLPYTSMYAASKLMNELHVHLYRQLYGVDAVACRPARVWGPGFDRWDLAIPIELLVRDAVAGKPIRIEQGGDTAIDYTYVKDHCQGLIQALEAKPTKNCVFNLSSGKLVSMFEVTDVLKRVFPKLEISVGPGQLGDAKGGGYRVAVRPAFDISRAKDELKYEPQYGIEKGIPAYVAWLTERKYL